MKERKVKGRHPQDDCLRRSNCPTQAKSGLEWATGPSANPTHGQTEFKAFQAGAGVNREHGFGPNDTQQIQNFLQNSPVYGPILNIPVFPNDPNFPQ